MTLFVEVQDAEGPQESQEVTALAPAARALIALNSSKTEVTLRSLVEDAKSVAEVKDGVGRDQAHRIGMSLKNARVAIEKTGKAAREDAQAFSKAVIDEQKRLIAITEGEEKRIFSLRDGYDAKLEAEKRAAEAKRAEIKSKIDGIRALPLALATASSEDINAEIQALQDFAPLEDVFGDQTEDCKAALAEAVQSLSDLFERVLAREAAAAEVEAERKAIEEARRQAEAELAAEREALAEERRKLQEELAKLEALRAPVAEEPEQQVNGHDISGDSDLADADVLSLALIGPETEPPVLVAVPSDWRIRQAAIHTAAQFEALAAKVDFCKFGAFAQQLRDVATGLASGLHDEALAKADQDALFAADELLLDATMRSMDAIKGQEVAA